MAIAFQQPCQIAPSQPLSLFGVTRRLLESLHEPAEGLEKLAAAVRAHSFSALVVDPGLNGDCIIDFEA